MFRLGRYHTGVWLGCAIFLSALMLIMVQPTRSTPLTPATWTVNTTADPGAPTCAATCSLRAAVDAAAPGDSIVFDASVFNVPLTIILQGQIEISKALTIDGVAGGGIMPTLSGYHMTRTFQVVTGTTVLLKALNIVAGQAPSGGGIYNSGWLTITDSTLSGNATDAGIGIYGSGGAGGGIFNSGTLFLANSSVKQNRTGRGSNSWPAGSGGAGGGIYNIGTLTIVNSTVSENTTGAGGTSSGGADGSGGWGGGIFNLGTLAMTNSQLIGNSTGDGSGNRFTVSTIGGSGGSGGGVCNAGNLSIVSSTVSGNWTGNGGDSYTCRYFCSRSGGWGGGGGGIYNYGILSMTNTTVSDNMAGNGGRDGDSNAAPGNNGGPGGNGGGVTNYGNLSVTNGTITGNKAGIGGVGYVGGAGGSGGGVFSATAVSITNSTFSENTTGIGGSGYITGVHGSGAGIRWRESALIMNSIIANGPSEDNCAAVSFQADGGYNLDSGNTCGFTTTNHSLVNTDPLLGVLGNHGGSVQTIPPLPGSPAIDAIPFGDNGCGTSVTTDARGVPRPQGAACDIGAFEEYHDLQIYLPLIINQP